MQVDPGLDLSHNYDEYGSFLEEGTLGLVTS
jgi:hypothetical protein